MTSSPTSGCRARGGGEGPPRGPGERGERTRSEGAGAGAAALDERALPRPCAASSPDRPEANATGLTQHARSNAARSPRLPELSAASNTEAQEKPQRVVALGSGSVRGVVLRTGSRDGAGLIDALHSAGVKVVLRADDLDLPLVHRLGQD